MKAPAQNKTDQLLRDLAESPAGLVFVPDKSPLWPHIARLACFKIVDVARTDAGVAAVRLVETDAKRIKAARNRGDEWALDELAAVGGSAWLGAHSPHSQAFKRLASIGVITRALKQNSDTKGRAWFDIQVNSKGINFFPPPVKSKVLKLSKGKVKS